MNIIPAFAIGQLLIQGIFRYPNHKCPLALGVSNNGQHNHKQSQGCYSQSYLLYGYITHRIEVLFHIAAKLQKYF
jgi:hypothetical protein